MQFFSPISVTNGVLEVPSACFFLGTYCCLLGVFVHVSFIFSWCFRGGFHARSMRFYQTHTGLLTVMWNSKCLSKAETWRSSHTDSFLEVEKTVPHILPCQTWALQTTVSLTRGLYYYTRACSYDRRPRIAAWKVTWCVAWNGYAPCNFHPDGTQKVLEVLMDTSSACSFSSFI